MLCRVIGGEDVSSNSSFNWSRRKCCRCSIIRLLPGTYKISGNMSLVAGGNVTDSTGNAISVKNSGGSATVVADENIASDDSNDEVKEAE